MATTKKVGTFVSKVLAGLNKTEAQVAQEKAERFVEDTIIDLDQQISNRRFDIGRQESNLKTAEKDLNRAKEAVETAIYSVENSTERYLDKYNTAKRGVKSAEHLIASIKNNIAVIEAEIAELNILLERLKA